MDFSSVDINIFSWYELNYIELETEIGIDAFQTLISNQEEPASASVPAVATCPHS